MNKEYKLNIYNTLTGMYKEIPVTEEIYNTYRRMEWNMDKRAARHATNEIPFSSLTGGKDGAYENFHEFISSKDDPLPIITDKQSKQEIYCALAKLKEDEVRLIHALFVQGKSVRAYASETGIATMTIQDRKVKILKKIKKMMDF